MLKDDWLMRIIKQSARMMGNILAQINTKNLDEAQVEIDAALDQYVGIDSSAAEHMSPEEMMARLGTGEMGGAGKLIFMTDLLQAEAMICSAEGDETGAYNRRVKALAVRLELAVGRDLSNANFDATIDDLIAALEEYVVPTPIVEKLFGYYEKSQQYDLAADTLDDLIDGDHFTAENMTDEGLAFYERLLRMTDTELNVGGITRDEVQAGFDALWKMQ